MKKKFNLWDLRQILNVFDLEVWLHAYSSDVIIKFVVIYTPYATIGPNMNTLGQNMKEAFELLAVYKF